MEMQEALQLIKQNSAALTRIDGAIKAHESQLSLLVLEARMLAEPRDQKLAAAAANVLRKEVARFGELTNAAQAHLKTLDHLLTSAAQEAASGEETRRAKAKALKG